MNPGKPPSMIEHISTCWPMIHNPVQFVMRYAPAIRKYVSALVRNPHDADEVAQDFLVRVLDKGFCPENVTRGRFRDYLKAAVRYSAISHLRRTRPAQVSAEQLDSLAQPNAAADHEWASEWRTCLLERVWQGLELHEQKTGSPFHTVLRRHTEFPDATSETHAAAVSKSLGRAIRADNYRQQLHRARQHFAKLIVDEVRQTLQLPTAESIEQELADLQLLPYVRDCL